MKILMKAEDVSVTMAQSSQVSLRLGAILDGKRRRRPLGRATIVSALLLTTTAVPLLAAAQIKSDPTTQAKDSKAQPQYRFNADGKTLWLITSTNGAVALVAPKSTEDKDFVDFDVPAGQMMFSAKTIRMNGGKFVLNGNIVISVRDKNGKDTILFKANGATLIGIALPNGSHNAKLDLSAKTVRMKKGEVVLNDRATFTARDKKDRSKIFYQFKAESMTLDLGVERPGKRISREVAASSLKPIVIYKTKRASPEAATSRGVPIYIHKSR